jgi:hypothetical protein
MVCTTSLKGIAFDLGFLTLVFGEEEGVEEEGGEGGGEGGREADNGIENNLVEEREGGILGDETVVGFVKTGEILTGGEITKGGIEKEIS